MPGDPVSPGRRYCSCGGTILACYDALADGDYRAGASNPQHIYFSVDDQEADHEPLRRHGARGITPIEARPWDERSFYAPDPFDNPLCFVDSKTLFTRRTDSSDE